MQTRAAAVVMLAAALLIGGCAGGGGGAFRDRGERDEAARLLLQREAEKERALREAEAEAEAARREKDERAEKAQREADEDAERRKREEAADAEQERRHRRELKEAEHDAKIRELHKGSAAPPPEVERYLIAKDKDAAAETEWAHELSYCAHSSETIKQWNECYDERVHRLLLKRNAADSDAWKAWRLMTAASRRRIVDDDAVAASSAALNAAVDAFAAAIEARNAADDTRNAAVDAHNDALVAWRAAPSHSDADEAAAFYAAKRRLEAADKRLLEMKRAWADAAVAAADASRAWAATLRAAVENWNWNTGSAPQTETTSAAAQNAQLAKAPQRADSNCYDGSKLLIQPHETRRDFDARCPPRDALRH